MKTAGLTVLVLISLLLFSACESGDGEGDAGSDEDFGTDADADSDGDSDSDADADNDADTDTDTGSGTDAVSESDIDTDDLPDLKTVSGIESIKDCIVAVDGVCIKYLNHEASAVCEKWHEILPPNAMENIFTPGKEPCDPGTLKMEALEDALERLNFYRWLGDMPSLIPDPDKEIWNQVAQCAVVTAANRSRDPHNPSPGATCYSEDAFAGASSSSLDFSAYAPAVGVDRFIFDMGDTNAGRLGHRRSLLSYFFDRVAIGFTRTHLDDESLSGATCLHMGLDRYEEAEALVDRISAYPPPGVMPHELTLQQLKGTAGEPLQWHLNIQNVIFSGATIQIYRVVGSRLVPLTSQWGELANRTMDGDGMWAQPADEPGAGEYFVDVTGSSAGDIGYRVVLADCGTGVPEDCDLVDQDCGADWLGCYQNSDEESYCMYAGFLPEGSECGASRWCEPGNVCVNTLDNSHAVCSPYCDGTTPASPLYCGDFCPGIVVLVGDAAVCKLE